MIKTTLCLSLAAASIALAQSPIPTNAPAAPKTISIQEMLVIGQSGMRLHSLAMITQGKLKGEVDERFLPGFKACSEDTATPVRSVSARLIGQHLVAGKENPNPEAIALLMKLARDESADVRYSAVYHGLTQIKNKSDETIELLVKVAADNREQGLYDRIIESLEDHQGKVVQILDKNLAEGSCVAFYEIYKDLTGKEPADIDKYLNMPSSRPCIFIFKGKGNDSEAFKAELEIVLKSQGIANPDLFISGVSANYVLLLKTHLTKERILVEKIFADHDRFEITQNIWLTPELEIQIDAMRQKKNQSPALL